MERDVQVWRWVEEGGGGGMDASVADEVTVW